MNSSGSLTPGHSRRGVSGRAIKSCSDSDREREEYGVSDRHRGSCVTSITGDAGSVAGDWGSVLEFRC